MPATKPVGRPLKVNMKIITKLADAIQHNYNITDACRYAGISRQTYYHHLNSQELFAETMATAKDNQAKVLFNFMTV